MNTIYEDILIGRFSCLYWFMTWREYNHFVLKPLVPKNRYTSQEIVAIIEYLSTNVFTSKTYITNQQN